MSDTMPLSRFRVIDMTQARAGPTAVRLMADWGADVTLIEPPLETGKNRAGLTGTRHEFDFQNLHRNKRSLTLNLKDPEGKAMFLRLAEKADVIIENFRPGVKHRLGIDYDAVRAVNPRIVYGSISGFGQEGPISGRAGLDQIAQGMGGLMSVTGLPGQGPVRAGIPMADLTGGMNCAMGVLVALLEREASGEGQWVHTSLLEAQISMMDFQAARYIRDGEVPGQAGNNHPTGIPTGVFPTSDVSINIQAGTQHIFKRLCQTIDAMDLQEDPAYAEPADRLANRDELNEKIAAKTKTWASADLIEALADAGVPTGPIYSMDQTFADPQVQGLNMDPKVPDGTKVVGQAVKLTRTPQKMHLSTPGLGEHTDEILRHELGLDADAIADLRARSVI